MKNRILSLRTLIASCLFIAVVLPAGAATTTLNPIADAYVFEDDASANFGADAALYADNTGAGTDRDSYLKFDTASVPNITSAKLRLYAAVVSGGADLGGIYAVANTAWTETGITWNNRPALGSQLGQFNVTSTAYAWYEIDVTAYVQAEFNAGRKVVSLALHAPNGTGSYGIAAHSREAANKPQLVITDNATNTPPTVSVTSPANGASFTQPANIALTASATDSDGIAQVEFLIDGAVFATDTTAPYEATWSNATTGSHQIVARATDSLGAVASSTAVAITVNAANTPPTVSVTSPANGMSFNAPANIPLSANATDSDGIAQVEFLIDGAVYATDTTAPYEATWSNATTGSHQIVARATDSLGLAASSTAVSVTVNAASGTSSTLNPLADAYVQKSTGGTNYGTAATLYADTTGGSLNRDSYLKFDTTGLPNITSAKLRLYAAVVSGGADLGGIYAVANTAWSETGITWNNKPALGSQLGQFNVTSTTYAWYEIDVTAYVQAEFSAGRKIVSLALHAPNGTGSYGIAAHSREAANPPQLLIVHDAPNTAPTVSLASPANGASYTTPVNIALSATATDSDGIAQVEFLIDGVVYATDTAAPYEATWTNATVGSHQIEARATDSLGLAATSTAVGLTANPAPTTYYYLETDQLGTPRLASDAAGVTVWRWDNVDPFGNNVADEDPDGNGQNVTVNLRFPGQYFDKETNLHYNYFRDYDPTTGRYIESDPIGLEGGINTYTYVGGNPVGLIDPLGLEAALPFPGSGAGAGAGSAEAGAGLGEILGLCARVVGGVVGGMLIPNTSLSQCQDLPQPKGCDDDDECAKLLAEIREVMRELTKRYMHQCRNKKDQWDSHVPAFEGKKRQLAKLVSKAEQKGCSVPPEAYEWLQTPCPLPGTPRGSSPGY